MCVTLFWAKNWLVADFRKSTAALVGLKNYEEPPKTIQLMDNSSYMYAGIYLESRNSLVISNDRGGI